MEKLKVLFPLMIEIVRKGNRWLKTQQNPFVIITYPDTWPLLPAFVLSLLHPGRVLLDLQDAVVCQDIHPRGRLETLILNFMQQVFMHTCACILVASPAQKPYLPRSSRVETLMFGYDSAEREELKKVSLRPSDFGLTLVYGGTFYGSRSPDVLIEGLAEFRARHGNAISPIRLKFLARFNSPGEESRTKILAEKYELSQDIEWMPMLDREAFLKAAAAEATHLLIITHKTGSAYAIPGKLFDYLLLDRPIVVVTEDEGLQAFLRESGLDVYFSPHSPSAVADLFESLLSQRTRGKEGQVNCGRVDWSSEAIARKLLDILHEAYPACTISRANGFSLSVMLKKVKAMYKRQFVPYEVELERAIGDSKTLLDVGCGYPSPIKSFSSRLYSVGVDIFRPSIERSREEKIHSRYAQLDVLGIGERFPSESFDCVLASDLIEHLSKKDGDRLLQQMEKIAKKRIVVFTPNGFLPQWDDKNPWNVHKSGWSVDEMRERGYRVIGINGWKPLRTEFSHLRFRPKSLCRIISDLTQKITRRYPWLAFQVLCIKEKTKA